MKDKKTPIAEPVKDADKNKETKEKVQNSRSLYTKYEKAYNYIYDTTMISYVHSYIFNQLKIKSSKPKTISNAKGTDNDKNEKTKEDTSLTLKEMPSKEAVKEARDELDTKKNDNLKKEKVKTRLEEEEEYKKSLEESIEDKDAPNAESVKTENAAKQAIKPSAKAKQKAKPAKPGTNKANKKGKGKTRRQQNQPPKNNINRPTRKPKQGTQQQATPKQGPRNQENQPKKSNKKRPKAAKKPKGKKNPVKPKAAAVKGEEAETLSLRKESIQKNDEKDDSMDEKREYKSVEEEPNAEAVKGDENKVYNPITIERGETAFNFESVEEISDNDIPAAEAIKEKLNPKKFGKHHFKEALDKDNVSPEDIREWSRRKRQVTNVEKEDGAEEKDAQLDNKEKPEEKTTDIRNSPQAEAVMLAMNHSEPAGITLI